MSPSTLLRMRSLRWAVLLLAAAAVPARAQEGGAILLSAVAGSVEIQEGPEQPWKAAAAGAEMKEGYSLRTGPNGRAQVTFPDKAVVWVKESSTFGMQSTLPLTRKVQLGAGEIKASIPHLKRKQSFEVHTANAVAAVRGTVFSVRTDPAGNIFVHTAYGEVKVHLLAEARTLSVPQGTKFEKDESGTPRVEMLTTEQEQEILEDWSPGLVSDQRDDVLEQKEADRASIEDFARQTDAQEQAISNLVAQRREADFEAGRTLVDVHGNLTRVDQRLLRPSGDSLQFVNLVKRSNYTYKDHGPTKPWTNTQGPVTDRLDSMQAFITFNHELPQDLKEWPSFFKDTTDITMKSADMVLTNQTDPTNILVIGEFGENCRLAPGPACTRVGKVGKDTLAADFYVGSVGSIADVRDTSKLLHAKEVKSVDFYSKDGQADGTLFQHRAAAYDTDAGAHFWLTSEAYVINNNGEIRNSDEIASSGQDPFTILRETAAEGILSLKTTTGGTQSNPGGVAPNIGGDLNIAGVNATNKNIDLVVVPDLGVVIMQKLASSVSEANN